MGEVNNNLNIFEQIIPTNKEITVTFSPNSSIISYEYRIIKDNQIGNYISVNNNELIDILLSESGSYQIEFKTLDRYYRTKETKSGIYNIDMDHPVIKLKESYIELPKGSNLAVLDNIEVYDKQDGDLLDKVITNYDELNLNKLGLKKLTYTVSDEAGNTSITHLNINVIKNQQISLLVFRSTLVLSFICLILFIISFRKSLKLEKRINRFSIESSKNYNTSITDKLLKIYNKIINKISNILSKSVFILKHSKRYDKFIMIVNNTYTSGLNFIADKFAISFGFLIIAVLANTIQGKVLSLYELIIPLSVGFVMPNILYHYKYNVYINKMENDLLQAIMIMNNGFKSGRSIIQSIYLVSKELDGAMAKEFEKMYLEMTLGLSVDVVFKRFAERLKLEEVAYLTASLTILNKTGGNIIKVFSSIEKTLFNKKKLKLELAALTGVSKVIVFMLVSIPLLFVIFIAIINPEYFRPLYATNIGRVLSLIMLVIYGTYIYVSNKIMKVRM